MSLRIEDDDSTPRESLSPYTYCIYDGDRIIARFWHDFRGDEHGIDLISGSPFDWPFARATDFIEGGGSEPLRLLRVP